MNELAAVSMVDCAELSSDYSCELYRNGVTCFCRCRSEIPKHMILGRVRYNYMNSSYVLTLSLPLPLIAYFINRTHNPCSALLPGEGKSSDDIAVGHRCEFRVDFEFKCSAGGGDLIFDILLVEANYCLIAVRSLDFPPSKLSRLPFIAHLLNPFTSRAPR